MGGDFGKEGRLRMGAENQSRGGGPGLRKFRGTFPWAHLTQRLPYASHNSGALQNPKLAACSFPYASLLSCQILPRGVPGSPEIRKIQKENPGPEELRDLPKMNKQMQSMKKIWKLWVHAEELWDCKQHIKLKKMPGPELQEFRVQTIREFQKNLNIPVPEYPESLKHSGFLKIWDRGKSQKCMGPKTMRIA